MAQKLTSIDRDPLKEMLTMNQTHYSMLLNTNENSKVPGLLKEAAGIHKEFVQKLRNDRTKTDTRKVLLAARHANKQMEHVFRSLDSERKQTYEKIEHFNQVVADGLKLDNITKILLAQNLAAVLVNKKWMDISMLMRSGDSETIRAMSLPVMKMTFDLYDNTNRQAIVKEAAERTFLGDDYQVLQNTIATNNVYEKTGEGLVNELSKNSALAKKIESTVVPEVA